MGHVSAWRRAYVSEDTNLDAAASDAATGSVTVIDTVSPVVERTLAPPWSPGPVVGGNAGGGHPRRPRGVGKHRS